MTDTQAATPLLGYQPERPQCPSNRVRTILALCAIGTNLLAQVGCIVVGVRQLNLLDRAAAGIPISPAEAEANDIAYRFAHVVLLLTLILAAIFLMMWMYRAHKNLPALSS